MISAKRFWDIVKKHGYRFFSGVPCSILAGVLDYAVHDPEIRYLRATCENNAIGVASGAYLAGVKSGILIQNSGLGNIINPLASFNLIYKVPVLLFITWRGARRKDAPEHVIMGEKTLKILRTLEIPHVVLNENCEKQIFWAVRQMEEKSVPAAVIIKKGIIE